jgi:sugar phosphate isomerase/epimerase
VLSLAAATTLDAGAADTIEAARQAGFDACGLRPAGAELSDRGVAELARRIADSGLSLLDVEVVRLGAPGPDARPLRLLDVAAGLGARFVLAVSHYDDPGRSAAELARLAEAAAGYGLRIALEFMRFTAVPTLASALDVLERTGRADVGVLVDALHLQRSGGSPRDLREIPRGRLAYVQLCDAVAEGPAGVPALAEEARHRRLLPGTGALPLRELLAELDPAVPVSVEVQSDALAGTVPAGRRARLAFEHASALLAARALPAYARHALAARQPRERRLRDPAVDHDVLSGDVGSLRRGEEHHRVSHVFRAPKPSHGYVRGAHAARVRV